MKLRQEVFNEALLLNQHTTQEEKDRLVVELVRPTSFIGCIYGLMTGDCGSDRACELIEACVPNISGSRIKGFVYVPTQEELQNEYIDFYAEATPIEIEIVRDLNTIPTIIGVIKGDIINNN